MLFNKNISNSSKVFRVSLVFIVLFIVILFLPQPYFIIIPGHIFDLDSFVITDNVIESSKNSFSLVTVSVTDSNLLSIIFSYFNPYAEIVEKNELLGKKSEAEYYAKQLLNMKMAEKNAIISALNNQGIKVEKSNKGVIINDVLERNKLKIGDIITAVNDQKINKAEDLIMYISTKRLGEVVELQILRDDKNIKVSVPIVSLKDNSVEKTGIGIYPITYSELISKKNVVINSKNIGGPSAGLMLALQIINELRNEDLTKGYKIAGTGTIDEEGNIGQIGGIEQKIVAANRSNIEIFFVPKDLKKQDSNQKIASQTVSLLKSKMVIIPVANLSEALDYLEKLSKKQ